MIRNDLFYLHYPYHGENDAEVSFVIGVIEVLRNVFFLKFDTRPPSLVYRIDDTIRIVDTLIQYTIRIAIGIISFNNKYCRDRN